MSPALQRRMRSFGLETKPVVALVCSTILLFFAGPAFASNFRGFISGVATFTFGVPLALISLLAFVVLALAGSYCWKPAAIWHARIASVPPLLGFIAAFIDDYAIGDSGGRYATNAVALVLAQLPRVFRRLRYGPDIESKTLPQDSPAKEVPPP